MQLQFANWNGTRVEAAPGLTAECPQCGKPVVAKCGPIRIWHWAHLGKRTCDPWWENQTPWHHGWKAEFPAGWREVIAADGNGEKHIADIRTPHGLCIEFQHSHLRPQERTAREAFYCPNLVWVVDGTRLKRDLPRFAQGQQTLRRIGRLPLFFVPFPQECFPQDWLDCRALVFFDFHGSVETRAEKAILWGLLPGRVEGQAVVVAMLRKQFVRLVQQTAEIVPARKRLAEIAMSLRRRREAEIANVRLQRSLPPRRTTWETSNRWPRRRGKAQF